MPHRRAWSALATLVLVIAAPGAAFAAVQLAAATDGVPPDDYDAANRSAFFVAFVGLTVAVGVAEIVIFTTRLDRIGSTITAFAAALLPGIFAVIALPVLWGS